MALLTLALLIPAAQAAPTPIASSDAELRVDGAGADRFGYRVVSGDFNGDAETDLAVSAPHQSVSANVYVFFGPFSLAGGGLLGPGDADITITGPVGAETGWSLASGDVIGDGTDDLIVGAPVFGGNNGAVHVFAGPLTAGALDTQTDPDLTVAGHRGGYAGWSVAAGDFDGDGKDELAIGACGVAGTGEAYLHDVDGSAPGTDTSAATSTFAGLGQTGCAMAGVGDLNADGFEELAIGSHGAAVATGFNWGGAVSLVWGRSAFDSDYAQTDLVADDIALVTAEFHGSNLGYAIAPAGDLNNDGFADLMIGAPALRCSGCSVSEDTGRVYAILGGPDSGSGGGTARPFFGTSVADQVADYIYEGEASHDGFGASVGMGGQPATPWTKFAHPWLLYSVVGDAMLFGSTADRAYVIGFDHYYRLKLPPEYICTQINEFLWSCVLSREDVDPDRGVRLNVGDFDTAAHVIEGDGEALGLWVHGPGDLDGDGNDDLVFGAPQQVTYQDPAGDGRVYVVSGD